MILLFEFVRSQVVQTAVRPDRVVVAPPGFDGHASLTPQAEPLQRQGQAFIPELAIEALVSAVPPGLARIAKRCTDARVGDPLRDGMADEVRTVALAKEQGHAMNGDQSRQHLDDLLGPNRAGHINGQAFQGVFFHHFQALVCHPSAAVSNTKS